MEVVYERAENAFRDWRETLAVAIELSPPGPFDVEWLIDRAEKGDWGGRDPEPPSGARGKES